MSDLSNNSEQDIIQVPVKRLSETAKLPVYASDEASGLDLYANIESAQTLQPGERALIPTGIAIAIPSGYEAQIRPRSGLAYKHGITLLNTPGTIDADYRGEIKIILINLGNTDYCIKPDTRIAQMVFAKVQRIKLDITSTLSDSKRAGHGFGSTGDTLLKN